VRICCGLAFTRYCFASKLYCERPSSFYCHPPPAKPTLLQYYCTTIARYTPLPTSPPVYAIHRTVLVMAISCNGQVVVRVEDGGRVCLLSISVCLPRSRAGRVVCCELLVVCRVRVSCVRPSQSRAARRAWTVFTRYVEARGGEMVMVVFTTTLYMKCKV